jgi:hypothetical protein
MKYVSRFEFTILALFLCTIILFGGCATTGVDRPGVYQTQENTRYENINVQQVESPLDKAIKTEQAVSGGLRILNMLGRGRR